MVFAFDLTGNIFGWLFSNVWGPIALTVFAFVYLFKQWDFIPDFIPLLGWIDDFIFFLLAVVAWGYYLGHNYLAAWFNDPTLRWVAFGVALIVVLVVSSIIKKKE